MTSPGVRRRLLTPGPLVAVAEHIWVLDEIQPVAVLLDADTAEPAGRVAWPEVPPGPHPADRVVLGAPDGLWVQQPGGPVVLIGTDGLRSAHYVADLILGAASSHGAWCAPRRAQDIAPTQDTPPQHPDWDYLRLARPGHPTTTVRVDAAVASIRSVGQNLFVEVETGTWSRRSLGSPTDWVLVSDTTWLRLGAAQEVPAELSRAEHGHDAPPTHGGRFDWSGTLPAPPQPGARGTTWSTGWSSNPTDERYEVYAAAFEEDTRTERWRVRLGPGVAVGAAATRGHIWVALQEPSGPPSSGSPRPRKLVRADVDTGFVEQLTGPLDIAEHCWPMGPPPVEVDDYVAYWSHHFSRLDAFWTKEDGTVTPLSEGLTDPDVEAVGAWPDTTLHVTFAWAARPGHRLRRIVPLYDDLGRIEEPTYADISIMEDLDTNMVATAPLPGSDYLDI